MTLRSPSPLTITFKSQATCAFQFRPVNTLERLVGLLVLERLPRPTANLKLKPKKCILMQKSISFLGHLVAAEGVATDLAKVKIVAEWPVPTA